MRVARCDGCGTTARGGQPPGWTQAKRIDGKARRYCEACSLASVWPWSRRFDGSAGEPRQETDEQKRLKAIAADALEVFGLDREPSVSLGALIARDIRIAQAVVAGVEWHVAVLTGESGRELDVCGIVAIDRAYAEITKGRLLLDVVRVSGCPIALVADGVPAVVLRALAKALRGEINAKTEA